MNGWLFTQTSTGATYLQVIIIFAFLFFVVAPLGYITIRDCTRAIRELWEAEKPAQKRGRRCN